MSRLETSMEGHDDIDLTMSDKSSDDGAEFTLASNPSSQPAAAGRGAGHHQQQQPPSSFAAALAPRRNLADELGLPLPPKSLLTKKEQQQQQQSAAAAAATPTMAPTRTANNATSSYRNHASSAPTTPAGGEKVDQQQQQQQQPASAVAAVAAANVAVAAAVAGSRSASAASKSIMSSSGTGASSSAATPSSSKKMAAAAAAAASPSKDNKNSSKKQQNPSSSSSVGRGRGTSSSAARSRSTGAASSSVDSSLQSVPEGVDFLYRMGKLYDTYRDRLRTEKEKLTKQTMRKVPEISEYAHRLRHSEDALTRLATTSVSRLKIHQKKREKERVTKIEQKEEEELKECTFHPKIDEISKNKPRHGTVHEFNQEWADRRDRRLELERERKVEKEFLESQPGPMLASAGKYADPDAAEARRHGLPIQDHLLEMGRQRERRLYEKVQTRLDGRSGSQNQTIHSRSGTPTNNMMMMRSSSAPNNNGSGAVSIARSETSIAESVVARLYTPGRRPAVYDEDYVQNCTFQPRVYSTFEDPLGHLPAHERLRMRGGSEQSVRRHQKLILEYDAEMTGHPRLSGKSVEIVSNKRAQEEQQSMLAGGGGGGDNNNQSAGITEMRSPSQRLYQDHFARDERLLKLQQEADRERKKLGHPVTNSPLKRIARKAGARPPSLPNSRSGTPTSKQGDGGKSSVMSSSADVVERNAHWERRKARNHASLREEMMSREEAELADCSFAPSINHSCSVPLKKTKEPFKVRSQQWERKREQKLADLARERRAELQKRKEQEEREIAELRSYQFKAQPAPEPPEVDDVPLGYEKFIERQQKGHLIKREKEEALELRPVGGGMQTGLRDYSGSQQRSGSTRRSGSQQQHADPYVNFPANQSTLTAVPEDEQNNNNIAHHYLISPTPIANSRAGGGAGSFVPPGQRMEQRIQHRQAERERRAIPAPTPNNKSNNNNQHQASVVTPHRFSYMDNLRRQMYGGGGGTSSPSDSPSPTQHQQHQQQQAHPVPLPQQFGVIEPDAEQYLDARHPHESPPRTKDERSFLTTTHVGGGLQRPMAPQLSPEAKQRQNIAEDQHDAETMMMMMMMQQQQQQQQQQQHNVRNSNNASSSATSGGRTFHAVGRSSSSALTPSHQDRTDRVYVQNTNHARHAHNNSNNANNNNNNNNAPSTTSTSARGSLSARRTGGTSGGASTASATIAQRSSNTGRTAATTQRQQHKQNASSSASSASGGTTKYSSRDEAEGDAIQQRARALLNRSAALTSRHQQQQQQETPQHHPHQHSGGNAHLNAPGALPPPPLPPTAPLLHH